MLAGKPTGVGHHCSRFRGVLPSLYHEQSPSTIITALSLRDVQCFVIGHGGVASKDDEQGGIFALDYLLGCELIPRSANSCLRRMMADILDKQRQLSDSAAKRAGTTKLKLAGFLFCLPGHGTHIHDIPPTTRRREIGRNDPCLCGSGLKYKKYCLELADYDEHIV